VQGRHTTLMTAKVLPQACPFGRCATAMTGKVNGL